MLYKVKCQDTPLSTFLKFSQTTLIQPPKIRVIVYMKNKNIIKKLLKKNSTGVPSR